MSGRVALLSFDDVPPIGGQGRYVGFLEREMPEEGFGMEVLSARRGPWGPGPRIPRRTRREPLDFSLWLRHHVAQAAAAVRPDLWHALGGPGGVLLFRHPPGAPLVYTANHTYRTAHGRRLATRPLGTIEARGYRFAEHVIAVSPSTAHSLVADYDLPAEQVSVIPVGIDTDRFHPGPEEAEGSLLFVGRLVPIKGLPTFLDLFRTLGSEFPGLRAEVCGDGPLLGAAEAEAAASGNRLAVRGRVSDEELAAAYRRARLLVVPSRFEGLGLVALEAMASGVPVVASDVPGLTDLGGEGTVLVPPGDAGALAEAVRGLLADPGRRRELGQRGRAHVLREYSWAAVRPRVAEVYRSVLGSSASQAS